MPTKKKVTPKPRAAIAPKSKIPQKAAPVAPVVEAPLPVKVPLTAESPKFPPIAVRAYSFQTLHPTLLIPWAQKYNPEVQTPKEAIEVLLRHEYGDAAYEEWAK